VFPQCYWCLLASDLKQAPSRFWASVTHHQSARRCLGRRYNLSTSAHGGGWHWRRRREIKNSGWYLWKKQLNESSIHKLWKELHYSVLFCCHICFYKPPYRLQFLERFEKEEKQAVPFFLWFNKYAVIHEYVVSMYSLDLNLTGLWVFEFLGFVNVQEEDLQQALSLTQFLWDLILMLEGQLFLVIFSILVKGESR